MMNLLVVPSALFLLIFPLSCRCQRSSQVSESVADPIPGPASPSGPVGHQSIQKVKGESCSCNICDYIFTKIEKRLIAMENKLLKTGTCSTNGNSANFANDECATLVPCQNKASCVNLFPGFLCICSRWYGGKVCEKDCSLGVRYNRKTIPDSAMSASSSWRSDPYHKPWFGRLNQPFIPWVTIGAWIPQPQQQGEWIEVALPKPETITGVMTQGRASNHFEQWVTSYKIAYLPSNTTSWKYVSYADGSDMVFAGNTDRTTAVTRRFPKPVNATKLRLYPQTYHGHMAVRHEYLVC